MGNLVERNVDSRLTVWGIWLITYREVPWNTRKSAMNFLTHGLYHEYKQSVEIFYNTLPAFEVLVLISTSREYVFDFLIWMKGELPVGGRSHEFTVVISSQLSSQDLHQRDVFVLWRIHVKIVLHVHTYTRFYWVTNTKVSEGNWISQCVQTEINWEASLSILCVVKDLFSIFGVSVFGVSVLGVSVFSVSVLGVSVLGLSVLDLGVNVLGVNVWGCVCWVWACWVWTCWVWACWVWVCGGIAVQYYGVETFSIEWAADW